MAESKGRKNFQKEKVAETVTNAAYRSITMHLQQCLAPSRCSLDTY